MPVSKGDIPPFSNAAALANFLQTTNEQAAAQSKLVKLVLTLSTKQLTKRKRLSSKEDVLKKSCDKLELQLGDTDLDKWWDKYKSKVHTDIRIIGDAFHNKRVPWILYNFSGIDEYMEQKYHFRNLLLYVMIRFGNEPCDPAQAATTTEPCLCRTQTMSSSASVTTPQSSPPARKLPYQSRSDDQEASNGNLICYAKRPRTEGASDEECINHAATKPKRSCQGLMEPAMLVPTTPDANHVSEASSPVLEEVHLTDQQGDGAIELLGSEASPHTAADMQPITSYCLRHELTRPVYDTKRGDNTPLIYQSLHEIEGTGDIEISYFGNAFTGLGLVDMMVEGRPQEDGTFRYDIDPDLLPGALVSSMKLSYHWRQEQQCAYLDVHPKSTMCNLRCKISAADVLTP